MAWLSLRKKDVRENFGRVLFALDGDTVLEVLGPYEIGRTASRAYGFGLRVYLPAWPSRVCIVCGRDPFGKRLPEEARNARSVEELREALGL